MYLTNVADKNTDILHVFFQLWNKSLWITRQARSQVWIWGVLFRRKWTFSSAFWEKVGFFAHILEKVDLFTCLFGESGFYRHVDQMSEAYAQGKSLKKRPVGIFWFHEILEYHRQKTWIKNGKVVLLRHFYEPYSDEVSAATHKFNFTWSEKTMTIHS